MAEDRLFDRPVRMVSETVTEQVPRGPLGFVGDGNAVGAIGLAGVQLSRTLTPGDTLDPGYRIRSHEVDRSSNTERHTVEIDAFSRNIAELIARHKSVPSNLDFIIRNSKVINTNLKKERRTAPTWEVTVQVADRQLGGD